MRSHSPSLNHGVLLLVGVLAGCPGPKQIGDESDTNINEPCMAGDMKPADDGCNTCSCVDGEWACTEEACTDEDAPPAECEEGDEKPDPDGCNTCSCYEGAWACTQIGCPATEPGGTETVGETGETETVGETAMTGDTTGDTEGGSTAGETGPGFVCGDGVLDAEEQCDDGNVADGDGCSSECALENVGACMDKPQDPLEVTAAVIEADTLVIDVSFGGGCETHEIDYCWDGSFAESNPVQVWLDLWHDGNDDPCDAIVMEQRVLDLVPLKEAWQAAYQQQSGEITVHLTGWDSSLAYSF
jgi:cysteine-rich repeat protein